MPFFEAEPAALPRVPSGLPPSVTPSPGFSGETFSAAALLENWPRSLYRALTDRTDQTYDPNYNPLDTLRAPGVDPKFEANHLQEFAGDPNEVTVRARMRRIEEEDQARETRDAAGVAGWVASIGMGLLDPTIALPGGVIVKTGRAGATIVRGAASVAVAGALQASVAEGALYATQETRTPQEVAVNVAAGTVLAGLLGGAAGAVLGRGERQALETLLTNDRQQWAASVAEPSVGAAAADTRELRLRGFGINQIPGVNRVFDAAGPAKGIVQGPTTRVFAADLAEGRRAMADLAETPLQFEQNVQGVATTAGPALDRAAKMAIRSTRVRLADEMDSLYRQHRFGTGETTTLQRARVAVAGYGAAPEGKLGFSEFKGQVDLALRSGDKHEVPEVAQAAQFIRREVLDPWKDRAIAAGLLPEDIGVETAASYMTRVWNKTRVAAERNRFVDVTSRWLGSENVRKVAARDKITELSNEIETAEARIAALEAKAGKWSEADEAAATEAFGVVSRNQTRIEEELRGWQGKSASDAVSALKARDKAEAAREEGAPKLASADKSVARAAKRITERWAEMSEAELRTRANEIADRILGGPDGRLPYDAPSGGPRQGVPSGPRPRGALAGREFMIPDDMIRDFLEQDVELTTRQYLDTFVPDVLLTERFGDVEMQNAFKKINEESAAKAANATSDKERTRIEKQRVEVIEDLAAVRDRIRGLYGWSGEAWMRNAGRVAASVKRYDFMTNLGGVALSSLPDMAGSIFRWGFGSALGNAWLPFLKHLSGFGSDGAFKQARAQFRSLGIAAETMLATRTHAWQEVTDMYRPQSRFERGLAVGSDRFAIATGITAWTDIQKTMAGMVASSEILKAAKAVAGGTGSKKQITRLAESGIDAPTAERIWLEFSTEGGGDTIDGVLLANTGAWGSARARDAFEGAIGREADIAVITPGQEKPLWLSRPVASVIGQYKSFVAAANERLLIANLQQHDFATLQGLVFSVGMGMVTAAAYSVVSGTPAPKDTPGWIKEGISRAGILGWFEEGNAVAAKMTRGSVDLYRLIGADQPLRRYQSRTILSSLLGPTSGKVETLAQVTGSMGAAEWSAYDTTRVRRLVAGQNLLYIRRLLDEVEQAVNGFFGVPPKEPVE